MDKKNSKNLITKAAAQGDVLFVLMADIPENAKPLKPLAPVGGKFIVAHSETGHHHTVQADGRVEMREESPFVAYLRSDVGFDVVHERSFDTHETLHFAPGVWKVVRQREHTPEGYRRVAD